MSELWLHTAFALGGGLGAVLRHWLTRVITHEFPLSTLIINIAGSLFLGLMLGYLNQGAVVADEAKRMVFGFCGGFTTFSSFAYQSLQLHRERAIALAAGNILLNIALCWFALWLGLIALGP